MHEGWPYSYSRFQCTLPHLIFNSPRRPLCSNQVVRKYKEADEHGGAKQLLADLYPKRHNSGTKCKLAPNIARSMHRLNLEHNGALSYAQLRDKLAEEGVGNFGESTVRRWYVALGIKVIRLYLR